MLYTVYSKAGAGAFLAQYTQWSTIL